MHLHLHIVHLQPSPGYFNFCNFFLQINPTPPSSVLNRLALNAENPMTPCIMMFSHSYDIMLSSHSAAPGYEYSSKHLSVNCHQVHGGDTRSVLMIACVRQTWCMSSYADNDNGYDRALMNHSTNGPKRPRSATTKLLQLKTNMELENA